MSIHFTSGRKLSCGVALVAVLCALFTADGVENSAVFSLGFEDSAKARSGERIITPDINEGLTFVPGKRGHAGYFSSGSETFLRYPLGEIIDGTDWTVAFWIRPERVDDGSHCYFRLYNSGTWGDDDYVAEVNFQWDRFSFLRAEDGNWYGVSSDGLERLYDGQWHHMTFVSAGGKLDIYVNGYKISKIHNTSKETNAFILSQLNLGGSSRGHSHLTGALDEFYIFDRSLTEEEVLELVASVLDEDYEPIFQASFDGEIDAVYEGVDVASSSQFIFFTEGVIGQGALVARISYDARGVLIFPDLPKLASDEFTVSFFLIPNWGGEDEGRRVIMSGRSGGMSLRMEKDMEGALVWKMDMGGKSAVVTTSVGDWQAKKPVHLAAGYSRLGNELFLAVDGDIVSRGRLPFIDGDWTELGSSFRLRIGDEDSYDRYEPIQAEAVFDELRVFNRALGGVRIEAESKRSESGSAAVRKGDTPPIFREANDKELHLWSLEGAWRDGTPTREMYTLNALWRFQVVTPQKEPDTGSWHYLAVPGRYSGHESGRSEHQFLIRDSDFNTLSKEPLWEGRPMHEYRISWHERSFVVPAEWQGKVIRLKFEDLERSQTGKVWLNGRLIGAGTDCYLYFDLPKQAVKFGETNVLQVRLDDNGQRWNWRGIKGDIWLEARPETSISEPQVITSVRRNRFTLNMKVSNQGIDLSRARLRITIKGENAPEQALLSPLADISPGEDKILSVDTDWADVRYWSHVDPYLYEYQAELVDAEGRVLDVYWPERFGFREFWVEAGDYVLNGNKIRLFNDDEMRHPTSDLELARQYFRLLKSMGFNAMRSTFSEKDSYMENVYRAADEEGFLILANIFGVDGSNHMVWNQPEVQAEAEETMRRRLINRRNHPSIVMWYVSINLLGYGWDYHPLKMAGDYLPEFRKELAKTAEVGGPDIIKKYDPTRTYFFQAGGNFGPIINSNAYFCWWPLAEKMEWPYEWSKRKLKPLHIIETSFPLSATYSGMDTGNPGLKPFFLVENAARLFGQEAYGQMDDKWLPLLADPAKHNAIGDQIALSNIIRNIDFLLRHKGELIVPVIHHWRGADISGIGPFSEVEYAFLRKSPHENRHSAWERKVTPGNFRQPGWRPDFEKWGAHIDIDPEQPTIFRDALAEALQPMLVYIGGEEERPTAQDRNYYAGETVRKSVVMVNDTYSERDLVLNWEASIGGERMAGGRISERLGSSEVKRYAISFPLPEVKEHRKLLVTVASDGGSDLNIRPFVAAVYPKPERVTVSGVALYDPRGMTRNEFSKLGIEFQDFSALEDLKEISLVVIGRECLEEAFAESAARLGLAEAINGGRVNLLLFEQIDLGGLGLELKQIDERLVFPGVNRKSTFFAGIKLKDLSNWRGDGTLVEAYPEPCPTSQHTVASPFWHWSNRNLTATKAIRRPNVGLHRPHLVAGKDLVYTTLLELSSGRGRIVFCQADVTGRTIRDPAAERLILNLVSDLSRVRDQKSGRILAYGRGAVDMLDELCLPFEMVNSIPATPSGAMLVARLEGNDQAGEIKTIINYSRKGGRVLLIPPYEEIAQVLGINLKPVSFNRLNPTAAGRGVLSGLSARDLFFRYEVVAGEISGGGIEALTSPAVLARYSIGNGELLLSTMPYDYFDKDYHAERTKISDSSNTYAYWLLKQRTNLFWMNLLAEGSAGITDMSNRVESYTSAEVLVLDGKWKFSVDVDDLGVNHGWHDPEFNDRGWRELNVPGYWEHQGVNMVNPNHPCTQGTGDYDGYAWYRTQVEIPRELRGRNLVFRVQGIDDFDWTYVDGVKIGQTGEETPSYWNALREYPIPPELTKDRESVTLAIRVFDARGTGGIVNSVTISPAGQQRTAYPYDQLRLPGYDSEKFIRW